MALTALEEAQAQGHVQVIEKAQKASEKAQKAWEEADGAKEANVKLGDEAESAWKEVEDAQSNADTKLRNALAQGNDKEIKIAQKAVAQSRSGRAAEADQRAQEEADLMHAKQNADDAHKLFHARSLAYWIKRSGDWNALVLIRELLPRYAHLQLRLKNDCSFNNRKLVQTVQEVEHAFYGNGWFTCLLFVLGTTALYTTLLATVIAATYAKIHGLRDALDDDFWVGWTWPERLVFLGLVSFELIHDLHCECFWILNR